MTRWVELALIFSMSLLAGMAQAGETDVRSVGLTRPRELRRLATGIPQYEALGALRPEHLRQHARVHSLGPYQPGKVPVLFIHGLLSAPGVWTRMLETLNDDPVLRARCQFWVVLYPTTYPLPEAAAFVRRAIDGERARIDPGRADPALDQMVIVGKSLGGNVAKLLVQSSGTTLWDAVFACPMDRLNLTPDQRAWLAESFFFSPSPSVKRVVFIATPHRGSEVVPRGTGRIVSALLHRDDPLREIHRVVRAIHGPGAFRPPFQDRAPDTMDNLEVDSPILTALAALPITPGLQYHTVVGGVQHEATLDVLSDGLVRYTSAHLEGAASERLIATGHHCEGHPEVIDEVRRALRLHLRELGARSGDNASQFEQEFDEARDLRLGEGLASGVAIRAKDLAERPGAAIVQEPVALGRAAEIGGVETALTVLVE